MPRDRDKNNKSPRGRRDRPGEGKGRPGGGKDRSGAARGPEKKFAKRGYAGKNEGGERRPYAGKREDGRPPRRDFSDRPQRFNRDDRTHSDRQDRKGDPASRGPRRDFRPSEDRDGEKRTYVPRGSRPNYNRGDRDARPASRSVERKSGDKRPPRDGDRSERKFGDRKFSRGDRDGDWRDGKKDRADRKSNSRDRRSDPRDRKSDSGDRGPRREFARDRSDEKPWQKRDDRGEGGRARFEKPRHERHRDDRGGEERPRFSRPREDRPKFDRPREARNAWQEHPRSERRSSDRFSDRPRRDNEDDSKVFAKRPAFGGRGAYRERDPDERRPARPPRLKKSGERIAKVMSRHGLASRRDAEEWVVQGRVAVNGRIINSPALDVTVNDVITVDGKPLPPRERTRLFLYHKPRGLMTTHSDPEGRPTVFDHLPEGLPRLISVGRLDFNTEGLLLLTNDGGLARALELPDTGWLRRYRVRAHGEVTQAQLDELKKGIEVDGVKYGSIDATLERDQGANVWLVFAIREGKNREVRNVMAHLGLEVNRLIRISYGPFQLAELAEGAVEEVKTRVLREQLGEKIATLAGADFNRPMPTEADASPGDEADAAPRGKRPFKPAGKSALIADRKGRRVLVQRTGSEEARARNELEANGYGPPRRPQRGYHGKRDLKPRDG
ncbi:MAG: pseudouridine synthase [Bradyrhizobium sp.]|uniref:pseudouridine synthase n=1 Tax=Bradyrhizobium sp. TaxID=376 RepID=UPI00238EF4BC|nr:pseudouridine synthase [Bradyrhizobium sp.]MDE2602900.1 pseudouridine synthase [Bradyrhizobium sp.]